MKRFICSILITLCVAMNCGVAVHYNYCHGRLTRVSVGYDAGCPQCSARKSCCGKCGCCRKVVEVVKVDMDQSAATQELRAGDLPVCEVLNMGIALLPPSPVSSQMSAISWHRYPPDRTGPGLFIVCRSIII